MYYFGKLSFGVDVTPSISMRLVSEYKAYYCRPDVQMKWKCLFRIVIKLFSSANNNDDDEQIIARNWWSLSGCNCKKGEKSWNAKINGKSLGMNWMIKWSSRPYWHDGFVQRNNVAALNNAYLSQMNVHLFHTPICQSVTLNTLSLPFRRWNRMEEDDHRPFVSLESISLRIHLFNSIDSCSCLHNEWLRRHLRNAWTTAKFKSTHDITTLIESHRFVVWCCIAVYLCESGKKHKV